MLWQPHTLTGDAIVSLAGVTQYFCETAYYLDPFFMAVEDTNSDCFHRFAVVAMIRGAKRYILSPPNQCSKLGIFTQKQSPIYRHSLLNFGHIQYLHQDGNNSGAAGMSPEERAWLERAATAQSVETVLKQGEVLYIPSHWFHYIISLQKSAQCNVRSGIDKEGNPRFGGRRQVEECVD